MSTIVPVGAQNAKMLTKTAAQWTAANTVLGMGQLGYESDTRRIKIGNGSTAWNTLDYSLQSPLLNVKDLGAYGDGIHDDTTVIQNAINSLTRPFQLPSYLGEMDQPFNAPWGGILYFPAGRYKITDTIIMPGWVTLQGDNWNTTKILFRANANKPAIQSKGYADLKAAADGNHTGAVSGTPVNGQTTLVLSQLNGGWVPAPGHVFSLPGQGDVNGLGETNYYYVVSYNAGTSTITLNSVYFESTGLRGSSYTTNPTIRRAPPHFWFLENVPVALKFRDIQVDGCKWENGAQPTTGNCGGVQLYAYGTEFVNFKIEQPRGTGLDVYWPSSVEAGVWWAGELNSLEPYVDGLNVHYSDGLGVKWTDYTDAAINKLYISECAGGGFLYTGFGVDVSFAHIYANGSYTPGGNVDYNVKVVGNCKFGHLITESSNGVGLRVEGGVTIDRLEMYRNCRQRGTYSAELTGDGTYRISIDNINCAIASVDLAKVSSGIYISNPTTAISKCYVIGGDTTETSNFTGTGIVVDAPGVTISEFYVGRLNGSTGTGIKFGTSNSLSKINVTGQVTTCRYAIGATQASGGSNKVSIVIDDCVNTGTFTNLYNHMSDRVHVYRAYDIGYTQGDIVNTVPTYGNPTARIANVNIRGGVPLYMEDSTDHYWKITLSNGGFNLIGNAGGGASDYQAFYADAHNGNVVFGYPVYVKGAIPLYIQDSDTGSRSWFTTDINSHIFSLYTQAGAGTVWNVLGWDQNGSLWTACNYYGTNVYVGENPGSYRTIGVVAATGSNNSTQLRLIGGDAIGTDKSGGGLALYPGASTGTGKSTLSLFRSARAGTSSSGVNAQWPAFVAPARVFLSDNVATEICSLTLGASKMCGGTISYTIFATDNTDFQTLTGVVTFQGVQKSTTITAAINTPTNTGTSVSAGTLTVNWSINTATTDTLKILCQADSSLTIGTGQLWIMYSMQVQMNNTTVTPA